MCCTFTNSLGNTLYRDNHKPRCVSCESMDNHVGISITANLSHCTSMLHGLMHIKRCTCCIAQTELQLSYEQVHMALGPLRVSL